MFDWFAFAKGLLFCGAALYLIVFYWDKLVRWWAEAHGIDTSKWDK